MSESDATWLRKRLEQQAAALAAAREALEMSEHDLSNRIGHIETLDKVRAALRLLEAEEKS